MIIALLDDPSIYDRLDLSGMASHLRDLPHQCRQAWNQALSFKLPKASSSVNKVYFLGMGGSAIGGDLLRALASSRSEAAFINHRDYGLPGLADSRTLVIASSHSGMTEETLDGFTQSLKTNCRKLVVTTGGKLSKMAEDSGTPAFIFAYPSPPRAALGYSLMPLLALLQKLRLIPDLSADVAEMLSTLEALSSRLGPDVPERSNEAKALAVHLHKRLPVIYGPGMLSPVAYRWKTQFNENSKSWAIAEALPELNHNSMAGLGLPENTRATVFPIMLQAQSMHERHKVRFVATGELLDKAGIPHASAIGEGQSELSQVMSLVLLGDWTSYYLAILNGVDPTPIPSIDYLKHRLNQLTQ